MSVGLSSCSNMWIINISSDGGCGHYILCRLGARCLAGMDEVQRGRTAVPLLITSAAGRGEASGIRSRDGQRGSLNREIRNSRVRSGPMLSRRGLVQTLRGLRWSVKGWETTHCQGRGHRESWGGPAGWAGGAGCGPLRPGASALPFPFGAPWQSQTGVVGIYLPLFLNCDVIVCL